MTIFGPRDPNTPSTPTTSWLPNWLSPCYMFQSCWTNVRVLAHPEEETDDSLATSAMQIVSNAGSATYGFITLSHFTFSILSTALLTEYPHKLRQALVALPFLGLTVTLLEGAIKTYRVVTNIQFLQTLSAATDPIALIKKDLLEQKQLADRVQPWCLQMIEEYIQNEDSLTQEEKEYIKKITQDQIRKKIIIQTTAAIAMTIGALGFLSILCLCPYITIPATLLLVSNTLAISAWIASMGFLSCPDSSFYPTYLIPKFLKGRCCCLTTDAQKTEMAKNATSYKETLKIANKIRNSYKKDLCYLEIAQKHPKEKGEIAKKATSPLHARKINELP